LRDARWEPGAGSHVLVGPNGAGKTSLLEAVYVLATSRSFRTPRLADCRTRGAAAFSVSGRVEGSRREDLEMGWNAELGPQRRRNGDSASVADYLQAFSVVCWSAEQYRLLDGGPRHRRRLLDQGVVSQRPGAIETLSSYRQALEHKRQLLKSRGRGLSVWNQMLAATAAEIHSRREEFVRALEAGLQAVVEDTNLELPPLELRYKPSPSGSAADAREMLDLFESVAARERELGRVLSGPHRDEMEILWDGVDISVTASAGEKKIFGLLLSLARAELSSEDGRRPTLLLDDVDAELDHRRLEIVAQAACRRVAQVMVTTSHEAALGCFPEARIWDLEGGEFDTRRGF
jgi:DNA replication and repair protein RecF